MSRLDGKCFMFVLGQLEHNNCLSLPYVRVIVYVVGGMLGGGGGDKQGQSL